MSEMAILALQVARCLRCSRIAHQAQRGQVERRVTKRVTRRKKPG